MQISTNNKIRGCCDQSCSIGQPNDQVSNNNVTYTTSDQDNNMTATADYKYTTIAAYIGIVCLLPHDLGTISPAVRQ